MKLRRIFLILSLLAAALPVSQRASAQEQDVNLLENTLNSVFGIGAWPDIQVPPSNVPAERIVYMGKSDTYSVMGVADYQKVRAYLAPFGYAPKNVLGHTPVLISVSINDEFVGCGCPKAFKEFIVMYSLIDDASAKIQVTPDLVVTDHPQRRAAMANKFGTEVNLGAPDASANGIILKDHQGQVIFRAVASGDGIAEPSIPLNTDLAMRSIGGTVDGRTLPQVVYQTSGASHMSMKVFNPRRDTLYMNPNHHIGQTLTAMEFRPLAWLRSALRGAHSWIP